MRRYFRSTHELIDASGVANRTHEAVNMHHGIEGSSGGELAATMPLFTASPVRAEPALPPQEDRIPVLDILRGLALIGMFFVHFNYYEATPKGVEPGAVAAFLERFIGLFVEERFFGIFGMLFGVGFAVQLERATARGESLVPRYLRRLAMLAVFGYIAEGVFGYNVLVGYAIWGLPLLFLRRWSTKALIVLALACTAARPIYLLARIAIADTRPGGVAKFNEQERTNWATFRAARDSTRSLEKSERWSTVIAARTKFMPTFIKQWDVIPSLTFPLLLFGLIMWRLGIFTRPSEHRRLIVGMMIVGVACTILGTFVLPFGGPPPAGPPKDHVVWNTVVLYARFGFQLIRPQWLAFTYIGAILLLVAQGRHWVRRLSALGWAGRMALTNYMMQVVFLDVMFTPHGFGLKIPALLVFPSAIALFVAQVYLSRWWLSRYQQGPLEWVMRSVTYWRVQPIRLRNPVPATALAA